MADYEELALLSLSGRGFLTRKTIIIPSPAAGSDFSFTVEGSEALLPVSLTALFTASAAVATRQVEFRISNSDGVIVRVATSNTVTASQAVRYGLHRGAGGGTSGATNLVNSLGMPDLVIMPGETLVSATTAIDAADQWSALKLTVLRVYTMSAEQRENYADQGFEQHFPFPWRTTRPAYPGEDTESTY